LIPVPSSTNRNPLPQRRISVRYDRQAPSLYQASRLFIVVACGTARSRTSFSVPEMTIEQSEQLAILPFASEKLKSPLSSRLGLGPPLDRSCLVVVPSNHYAERAQSPIWPLFAQRRSPGGTNEAGGLGELYRCAYSIRTVGLLCEPDSFSPARLRLCDRFSLHLVFEPTRCAPRIHQTCKGEPIMNWDQMEGKWKEVSGSK